jgi:hypothetical protein
MLNARAHTHTWREKERENLKAILILRCSSYSFVKIFFAHKAPWAHSVRTDINFNQLFLSIVSNRLRHDPFVSARFLKHNRRVRFESSEVQ